MAPSTTTQGGLKRNPSKQWVDEGERPRYEAESLEAVEGELGGGRSDSWVESMSGAIGACVAVYTGHEKWESSLCCTCTAGCVWLLSLVCVGQIMVYFGGESIVPRLLEVVVLASCSSDLLVIVANVRARRFA